jgi:aspartyl/asparaginyl beta-hydroxylase (cupin superfamily)
MTVFGEKIELNRQLCPITTALVDRIPGLTVAAFSRIKKG